MPIIRLTRPMMQFAQMLAEQRGRSYGRQPLSTYGKKRSYQEAHMVGAVAEVACAHHFDVDIDVNEYEYGDNGVDLVICNRKISVKATEYYKNPLLRVDVRQIRPDHIYFGCAVRANEVNLFGWATAKMLEQGELKQFVPGGPQNRVLKPHEMAQFSCDIVRKSPQNAANLTGSV